MKNAIAQPFDSTEVAGLKSTAVCPVAVDERGTPPRRQG